VAPVTVVTGLMHQNAKVHKMDLIPSYNELTADPLLRYAINAASRCRQPLKTREKTAAGELTG
jgi:hypothetical protein